MEKNGRNSCTGGNSRHINIRYFFVKDRVDKGELTIEYCPTGNMLADFFTKPLQGSQFTLMRDIIMGYKPISLLLPTIKERVENKIIMAQNKNTITHKQINDPSPKRSHPINDHQSSGWRISKEDIHRGVDGSCEIGWKTNIFCLIIIQKIIQ
mmetsp:Transcript_19478/g.22076  ORF Transcript_19478/g.22076 Transcript_19478/m.22076 type:complete len:153 (+) Transcript_19478:348-806(+)